jgi:hypothetical protein
VFLDERDTEYSMRLYTGIRETVVLVGVQRLFFAILALAWLFCYAAKKNRQCAKYFGSIASKNMAVKNDGRTIDSVEA